MSNYYQIPPDALKMEAAALFINRNPLTFRCNYKRVGVPHVWIGGGLYFFPSELREWDLKNPNVLAQMAPRNKPIEPVFHTQLRG